MSVHSHVSYGRDGSGQGPIHTFVIGFALRFVHCVSGAIVRLVLRQACVKPQGLLAAAPSAPARAWTAGNAGVSSRQLDARPASASATVRAVMLTMRRTVAEAVSTCTGFSLAGRALAELGLLGRRRSVRRD